MPASPQSAARPPAGLPAAPPAARRPAPPGQYRPAGRGQPAEPHRGRDRRNITLAVVLCAQLMIILDVTVVNVALPSMAAGLHLSAAGLSWVLNAYALTFGGLLLLGGRAGDILGRTPAFMAGLAVFTAASLAAGLASDSAVLLIARAVQGAGAGIASPAVLATIVASFPEGRERLRALALFTAVATGGISLGLVLGGVITQWASWRWVFFINVPVGIAVIALAPRLLGRSPRQRGQLDLTGAITSTAGMAALVYAFVSASSGGWSAPATLGAFAAAAVLLAAFVATEARISQPITPLRLFADRSRVSAWLVRLLVQAGLFGSLFFLTQFIQEVLGFSPVQAGLAFIPLTAALFAASRLAPQLAGRIGGRPVLIAGMLPVTAAMAWFSQVTPGSAYFPGLALPMALLGAGMGLAFVPLTMASLAGVAPADSGAAASMVNVTQQVGGALGLAVLVTIYTTASHAAARHPALAAAAQQAVQSRVHGMDVAFGAAAAFDAAALLIALAIRFRQPAAQAH